jgi:hypothetical protein
MAGTRFTHELTDLPAEMSRDGVILHRIQRNSAKSPRMLACLLCGRTEDLDPVRGLCTCCNPTIERWRRWRVDVQGQPPFYEPAQVTRCADRAPRTLAG